MLDVTFPVLDSTTTLCHFYECNHLMRNLTDGMGMLYIFLTRQYYTVGLDKSFILPDLINVRIYNIITGYNNNRNIALNRNKINLLFDNVCTEYFDFYILD